jgi:predicted Zn-dependent peptidase
MKRVILVSSIMLAIMSSILSPSHADELGLKLPPYKKVKLHNGLTVLLMERHELPLVSFQFIVKTGSVADPAGKEGVAEVTAELLRKGTAARTADKISEELDFVGATFGSGSNRDYTMASAEFVKKDLTTGLGLLADLLQNANFPQGELDKALARRIDGIKAAKDQVQGVIRTYFNSYLYGAHPYGRPPGGDEKSLSSITRDDVARFYRDHYAPDNTILAIVGDFNAAEMERAIGEKFGAWASKAVPTASLPEPVPVKGKKLLLVDKPDSVQTYFILGNLGISRTNPDRVFINVVNTLFGGRFTSLINTELRIKSGLTYGANSFFDLRKVPGPFSVASFTRNETTGKALDMTLDVIKRFHENGVSEDQLKSAKSYIKGQFPPSIETSDELASQIALLEFYGLDQTEITGLFAKIDSMTAADGNRIIKQYFPQDEMVFVLIGKASEIQDIAAKLAPTVDKKSISDRGF